MSQSPLAFADSLRIGSIDFVSPDEVKVLLDIEAPESLALNTGSPRPFPRINGYVLIPSDNGYLVGQVEWITIERSQYPKRKGMQDFGLVDLPYPLRKLCLNPIGTLATSAKDEDGNPVFRFRRGVESFPSVGDHVLLPTAQQLRSIIESGTNRHVKIGSSPLADGAEVRIDPNRLFGRHLAVLGNTGSGKSCSVAGLIRWSLATTGKDRPNARFIILDPNGEYSRAFADYKDARQFKVGFEGDQTEVKALKIPLWFWNSAEWAAFTQASGKTQRPTLVQALRSVREGTDQSGNLKPNEMRRYLRTIATALKIEINAGRPWGNFPHPKNFFEKIKVWRDGLVAEDEFSQTQKDALDAVLNMVTAFEQNRQGQYPTYEFNRQEIQEFRDQIITAYTTFGGTEDEFELVDPDIPIQFTGDDFLQNVEATADLLNVSEYVETLLMRLKSLLSDARMKSIIGQADGMTLEAWLSDYIGGNKAENGTVTIIDLSLVPSEVVHLLTTVIARMTFESLQRYRRIHPKHKVLPTVLVMEEAHTFVKRYKEDGENHDAATTCCQLFEKIAREGRKFGLGLVLSSQRPSELSPTVLSQCNTFLLHRISNDRDQELVHKLVPDNLRGLLRDLPSLPSQNAILLGWASELPVLVRIRDLPKEHQPQSDDPDFWEVWTHKEDREVDWNAIANEWQRRPISNTSELPEPATGQESEERPEDNIDIDPDDLM
ncbi:ATP-binding protein [Coraliomargarita parva]|uniref:ATP-binding protein n=1 Tax=Coraliomargarita parva TaxID=3014050 RepID=UPI0022B528A6|nr:ATP-binding protein [Coraliomargarita parva]